MNIPTQPIYYGIAAVVALGGLARWAIKRWRVTTINHVFIRDMACNHLPHIYTALELIGQQLGVKIEEHPKIKFLDEKEFEGK